MFSLFTLFVDEDMSFSTRFFQSSGLSGAHHCSLHQSEDEQIQDVGADQREALAQVLTSETEKKNKKIPEIHNLSEYCM